MQSYRYAVQRASGQEIAGATIKVKKAADVSAQHLPDGSVRLLHEGQIVAFGSAIVPAEEPLTLIRYPAGKRSGDPAETKKVERL